MPDYGRHIASQRGRGGDYTYGAREAASYLSGEMADAYRTNTAFLAKPMQGDKFGYKKAKPAITQREDALQSVNRLRDIAGMNALGEFQKYAIGFSKPWKVHTTDEGFLTEETFNLGEGSPEAKDTGKKMSRKEGSDKTWTERYNALKTAQPTTPDTAFSYANENWNQDSRLALKEQFQAARRGEGVSDSPYLAGFRGRDLSKNRRFGGTGATTKGGMYISPFQQRVNNAYLTGGLAAAQSYVQSNPELAYAGI